MRLNKLDDISIGYLFVAAAVCGYACLSIFTKLIYQVEPHLVPTDIGVLRFGVATPIIWLLTAERSWRRAQAGGVNQPVPRGTLVAAGLFLAVAAFCVFWGLQFIEASTYVVLFFTYPAMIAVLNAVRGNPLPMRGWFALVLTTIGIVFTAPGILTLSFEGQRGLGVLAALTNSVTVLAYYLLQQRAGRGHNRPMRAAAWTISTVFVCFAVLALFNGLSLPRTAAGWGLVVGIGTLSTVLPIVCLVNAISRLGASRTSIAETAEPVLSIALAALVLGESIFWYQIVGAALVCISVIMLVLPSRERPTPSPVESYPTS